MQAPAFPCFPDNSHGFLAFYANPQVIMQEEARPGDYAAVWSDVTKINTELKWK